MLLLRHFAALLLGATTAGPAADPIAACVAQLREAPRSLEPYQCLMARASEGQGAKVRGIVQDLFRKAPDDPRPRFYLALLRSFAGEPVPPEEFERAAEGFRREGEHRGLVYALTSLAAHRCAALHCGPDSELVEAEKVAEESDDPHLRRLVQLFWLRRALLLDDMARAERAEARLLGIPAEDPPWLARQVNEARGLLADQLVDLDRQASLWKQAVATARAGTRDHAVALGQLASARAALATHGRDDRAQAIALLREALDEEHRAGVELTIGGSGAVRSTQELALLLGPGVESRALLRENLAALERSGIGWQRVWRVRTRWLLARDEVEAEPRQPEDALNLADRALDETAPDSWERAHGLLLRAHVLWRSGRPEEAANTAETALHTLETFRDRQLDLDLRLRYEDQLAVAYELVAGALVDPRLGPVGPGQIEQSLRTMERLRARVLLQILLGKVRRGDPTTRSESVLQATIAEAHGRLLGSRTGAAGRAAVVEALRSAEARLHELRAQRVGSGPEEIPSVPEVQAALGPTEALASFQIWSPEARVDMPYEHGPSSVILVTRTSLRVLSVPDAETLDPKITFFRSLLERRDGSDRAGGRVLHDLLVRPLLDALPESIDSLVVVPDGPLSRLPLDALPLGSSSGYLAERLQVSVVPSVAVWLRLRRTRPDRSGSSALAVAVPEHPGMDPLPHAAEEARRALRAFPAPGQLLLGAAATRSAVLGTDLAPFGLLHLATHSVADTLHPERSAIALGGPTGDDELQVEDISGLSLDGQAVVLASCNTLSGPVRRAEGVISLARPFLAAGAQAVVGSIEVLGDTASTRLFDRFYAGIERGETVGHALAASKRRMIASGAPAAAWSGVVLVGNSAAAPREGRSSSSRSRALWLGLAAVLLASALLVVRRAVARR